MLSAGHRSNRSFVIHSVIYLWCDGPQSPHPPWQLLGEELCLWLICVPCMSQAGHQYNWQTEIGLYKVVCHITLLSFKFNLKVQFGDDVYLHLCSIIAMALISNPFNSMKQNTVIAVVTCGSVESWIEHNRKDLGRWTRRWDSISGLDWQHSYKSWDRWYVTVSPACSER